MEYGQDKTKKYWIGEDDELVGDIDLEALVRNAQASKASVPDVEEEEEISNKHLIEMKSDMRSMHVMIEMLLDKLDNIENVLKKKVTVVNEVVPKKREAKKVSPDAKRYKTAKITEVFEKKNHDNATMTQCGFVTVFGTTHSGHNI